MKELAIMLRASQLYAHAAHNLAKGQTFFEDHGFFGELYAAYEAGYDDVIERMIGLNKNPDIQAINDDANDASSAYEHSSTKECYEYLLQYEREICDLCSRFNKGVTLGTQNLLQGLADDSEKRQYKIQQRLK